MTDGLRALTEAEYEAEARPAFDRVFRSADPFDEPVGTSTELAAVLYPVEYELDARQLAALVVSAKAAGDEGFYLSALERPPADAQDRPYHWYVPFAAIAKYRDLGSVFVLENALYSASGRWGLMISHESHAVVAGTNRFVGDLLSTLATPRESQARAFIEHWRANRQRYRSDVRWLPFLLANVLGPSMASALLGTDTQWLRES
jgi:hypothetical protein